MVIACNNFKLVLFNAFYFIDLKIELNIIMEIFSLNFFYSLIFGYLIFYFFNERRLHSITFLN